MKNFATFGLLLASLTLSAHARAQDTDIYKTIFEEVDRANLITQLKNMTGDPVTVNGQTFAITDRYSPQAKAHFRAYFTNYFEALGYTVTEQPYPTQHANGESQGHNVEAVLKGKSADSVIIIVHYDSIGVGGSETANPAVDDDMTGMSISLETARILAQHKNSLLHTVRFVASDYEEWAEPELEGATFYAGYIEKLAQAQGFKIIGGIDNEQTGWNCARENRCGDQTNGSVVDVYSCSADSKYNFTDIGDQFSNLVTKYASLSVKRACIGGGDSANSDMYALWQIGVPMVVYTEHSVLNNPHFDDTGDDTFDKIDQDYFFKIAQTGVTFAAELVGVQ